MSLYRPIRTCFALLLICFAFASRAQVTAVGGKTTPGSATVPIKVQADGSVVTSGTASSSLTVGGNPVAVGNPLPTSPVVAGAVVSSTNPMPVLAAKALAPAAGAPAARVSISTGSAAATGLTAGAIYRVACSTDCFFRLGSGTPTAVTTDSAFFGPGVEYVTIPSGSTAIAFVTTAGTGFCTVHLLTIP